MLPAGNRASAPIPEEAAQESGGVSAVAGHFCRKPFSEPHPLKWNKVSENSAMQTFAANLPH